MPDDEEARSADSGHTSLGSQDSFDDHAQTADRTINMNHCMAAYVVPMIQASDKIQDVSLHVLNEAGDF